ncbi:TIGR02234 family membrane protein [Kitasatospora viridis]|uniref:TIGR02234 family membrane protein n=1 Tax=Kitasatospora viridis TaxID=281105 RepID=UPI0011A8F163|nr:TIGR02234 family membrane protein [Kitasatospora viridis]
MTAVPAPPADSSPQPSGAADRRSLAVMLLLIVLGAVLVLWAVGRTWASGKVSGLDVGATGSDITGAPGALALVGLASAVAVFAVRGVGRVVLGLLVVLAGAGTALAAGLGAGDSAAIDADAAKKLGLTGVTAEQVSHSAWPWLAVLGGVLLALAGLLTVLRGRGWPSMGARYEAPTAKRAPAPKDAGTPADLWKALDRGEDPTAT